MSVPQVCLDAGDAVELGELLGFLDDWLACGRAGLAGSLGRSLGAMATTSTGYTPTCPGSGSYLASMTGNGFSAVMHSDTARGTAGGRPR